MSSRPLRIVQSPAAVIDALGGLRSYTQDLEHPRAGAAFALKTPFVDNPAPDDALDLVEQVQLRLYTRPRSDSRGTGRSRGRRQATARLIGSTLLSLDRMASSRSAHSCIILRRGSRYCALL